MRRALGNVVAAGLLVPAACRGPHPGPASSPPPWERLAAAHNQRVDGLSRIHADGVVEIRWTDGHGRHFEQGDAEVWLSLPDRTAIDITKFGERLMWLGCDEQRAWVFEFDKKDGIALRLADRCGSGGDLPVEPAAIIALAGLQRLPGSGVVASDGARDAWVLAVDPAVAPLRLYLDRRSMLPVRVELLDEHGGVVLHSRIEPRRYEPLRLAGTALASESMFPTLVDVFSSDDGMGIKLSLRDPEAVPAPEGYFDLDWLTGRFRPARVEGIDPVAARAGGPAR